MKRNGSRQVKIKSKVGRSMGGDGVPCWVQPRRQATILLLSGYLTNNLIQFVLTQLPWCGAQEMFPLVFGFVILCKSHKF